MQIADDGGRTSIGGASVQIRIVRLPIREYTRPNFLIADAF